MPLKMDIEMHKHSAKHIISVENIAKWHNINFKLLILLLPGKDMKNLGYLNKKFNFFWLPMQINVIYQHCS